MCFCIFELISEDGEGINVEGDPPIGVSLCVLFKEAAGDLNDGAFDCECAGFEVDIAPSNRAKFASPRSGGSCDMEKARQIRISVMRDSQEFTYLIKVGR
jgi:hypothetical protein